MRKFLLFGLLLCLFSISTSAQITTSLQLNSTANTNGSPLNVSGSATATLTVNCSSCAGGTTVNFEATQDGIAWAPISGLSSGDYPPIYAYLTTDSGLAVWSFGVSGFRQIRARISNYSSGVVTVTGTAVALSMRPTVFGGITINNLQLTGSTNDLTSNWRNYTNQITRVACPAAGCSVLLPASTVHAAPPQTVFIFASVGPGIMTVCAGSGSLLYPKSYLGLPGSATCPAGLGYVVADYDETDWIESDGNNNYFISPSTQRLAFCTPYVVPANVVTPAHANGGGWGTVFASTMTLNSAFSTDCLGPDAMILTEDASVTNFHSATYRAPTTVTSGQTWSASIFCKVLTGDRYCRLQGQDTFSAGNQANIVANPQSASTTGAGCTLAGPNFSNITCQVTPYGPGVVKLQVTWQYNVNDTGVNLNANLYSPGTGVQYTGNGKSGAIWWGLCLRQGTSC